MWTVLNELLRGFVERGQAAGVSALVCGRGLNTRFCAHGCADIESKRPFERDTLCHIYSMTKIFTVVAFMTLVDAGAVRLDQPVSDFCPEYRYMSRARRDARTDAVEFVDARTPLTFRHLLTMTSGMPYESDDANPVERAVRERIAPLTARMNAAEAGSEPYTAARFAREMAGMPLMFEPGQIWHYGLSLDVLGGLIEIITGTTLENYMRRAIFDKLGMNDTYFRVPEAERGRVARIYTLARGALEPWRRADGMPLVDARALCSGGAGLASTIDDCARLGAMLASGGALDGERVLSARSVELMRSDMLGRERLGSYNWLEERGYTYGLGVRVMLSPGESEYAEPRGAFGWNGMAGTSLRIYPDAGRAAVFFIQLVPAMHSRYLPDFVRAVNAECAGAQTVPGECAALNRRS